MVNKTLLATIITFALSINPALAWNSFGHMVVAAAAYKKLTPSARQRAIALLKLNPDFEKWKALANSSQMKNQDEAVFIIAATWPDVIKGESDPYSQGKDSKYKSDGAANGFRPAGKEAWQNIGYSDRAMHKYWHFIGIPYSIDGTKPVKVPSPNVQTQIDSFRSVIASDAPDSLKSYDLTWLIHLVGDIHQPLHCLSRVNKALPLGDDGGFKLNLKGKGCEHDLHAFWDAAIGSGTLKDVAKVANGLPRATTSKSTNLLTQDWIDECVTLAKLDVYVLPIDKSNGPFQLTLEYREKAQFIARQQAALAGARLANLLNSELR